MNNLAGVLRESADRHPNLIAVNFMGQKTTYRELEEASNKIANALKEMGIKKGLTGFLAMAAVVMLAGTATAGQCGYAKCW